MGRILSVYIDDETEKRLEQYAKESERTVVDLAESAIADAASQVRMPPELQEKK